MFCAFLTFSVLSIVEHRKSCLNLAALKGEQHSALLKIKAQ
jgi:hypothetical protein